jgi:hypothetical protein
LEPLHLGAQGSQHQHKGASNGVGSKGDLKSKDRPRGIWTLSLHDGEMIQSQEAKFTTWTFVAQILHKVMVARFQFKNHVTSLFLLGCLHALHFLVLYMVGCVGGP